MISIKGVDKAAVLAALYNNSKPLGMGMLHFDPAMMTTDEARKEIEKMSYGLYFDYLKGRVMKVDLSGDELNPALYDRDNGDGAALAAIKTILDRSD